MVTPNHSGSSQEENDISSEQKEQEYQDIDRQDEQLFNTWLTLGLAASFFPIQKQAAIYDAFSTLAQPPEKTIENLLDFTNPVKYRAHDEAVEITRKQFKKREKKLKRSLQPDERVKVRFYHKSVELGPEDLLRQRQAHIIAREVHNIVNNREIDIRIQNTIRRYGLEENAEAFRGSIQQWLKENPGRNLDQALIVKATKFSLAQEAGVDVEALDKRTEKQLEHEHKEELNENKEKLLTANKSARGQAIESVSVEKDGTAARAKDLIEKDILNPNQPPLSPEQLGEAINEYIVKGVVPQTGPITERKLAGGFAEIPTEFAEEIMGAPPTAYSPPPPSPSTSPPPPPTPQPQPPSPPPITPVMIPPETPMEFAQELMGAPPTAYSPPAQSTSPPSIPIPAPQIPSIPLPPVSTGTSSFFSSAKSLLGGLGKTIGNLGGLGKEALLNGLGALASGGTSLAVKLGSKILDSLSKRIIGVDAKTAGFIAVGAVALIFILTTNKIISGGVKLFSRFTSKNPLKVSLDNKIYSWSEFEKKFLAYPKERPYISWQQFEKENLISAKEYLSEKQSGE